MSAQLTKFEITLEDKYASDEILDRLTTLLIRDLRDLGATSVERPQVTVIEKGARGDPFTIGALVLVALPALLPQLLAFLQGWLVEGRKVVIEAPNGAKIEFVPEKKLSENEIMALLERLNQTTNDGNNKSLNKFE